MCCDIYAASLIGRLISVCVVFCLLLYHCVIWT